MLLLDRLSEIIQKLDEYICYSQTEYLQLCFSQRDWISIFCMSDVLIGCWLLTDGITIFYFSDTYIGYL